MKSVYPNAVSQLHEHQDPASRQLTKETPWSIYPSPITRQAQCSTTRRTSLRLLRLTHSFQLRLTLAIRLVALRENEKIPRMSNNSPNTTVQYRYGKEYQPYSCNASADQ
jgi:hypothetical protein